MEKKIYAKLVENAQRVFENCDLPCGNYSARDVDKYIGIHVDSVTEHYVDDDGITKTRRYDVPYPGVAENFWKNGQNSMEIIQVQEGTFTCSLPAWRIFAILAKYEKLIPAKNKFTFEKREDREFIAEFIVPKNIGTLVKMTEKKSCRKLDYVCLDLDEKVLVAADGCILSAVKIPKVETFGATGKYLLPTSVVKKGNLVYVEKSPDGKIFANNVICGEGTFPNWKTVFPKFNAKHEIVRLGKEFTALKDAVKGVAKNTEEACDGTKIVHFSGKSGEKSLTVYGRNEVSKRGSSRSASLQMPLPMNVHFVLDADRFILVDCDRMFFKPCGFAIGFVSDGVATILMPCLVDGDETSYYDPHKDCNLDILEMSGIKEVDPVVEDAPVVEISPVVETKNLPVPEKEVEEETPEEIVDVAPEESKELEETPAEPKEIVTVNGIAEGDFVELKIYSGETIIAKVFKFANDKVRLFVGGCTFNFSTNLIAKTDATKKTKPSWLKIGQTMTDGIFVSEIVKINRSSVVFADGVERKYFYLLTDCRPATDEEKNAAREKEVAEIVELEKSKKKSPFGWIRNIIRKAATFSF